MTGFDSRNDETKNLTIGGADSTIRKWDMTTCECLFVYEGHTSRIQK